MPPPPPSLLLLLLLPLAASTPAAQHPPADLGRTIAARADVVWPSPAWADDGTGAAPIGNGDTTAMVWVSASTGDLRVVLGKSDAFDENSMKVKVGALRVAFDPPLWQPAAPLLTPSPHSTHQRGLAAGPCTGLSAFHQANSTATSTIGDQHHMLHSVWGWKGAAAVAAELCCNTSACVAFSIDADWGLELFSTTATDVDGTPGGHWKTWISKHTPTPPAPAPGPAPAPAADWGDGSCDADAEFCQTLSIASSTVSIVTRSVVVNVTVDLNPPLNATGQPDQRGGIVRVRAATRNGSGSSPPAMNVTLEPYLYSYIILSVVAIIEHTIVVSDFGSL